MELLHRAAGFEENWTLPSDIHKAMALGTCRKQINAQVPTQESSWTMGNACEVEFTFKTNNLQKLLCSLGLEVALVKRLIGVSLASTSREMPKHPLSGPFEVPAQALRLDSINSRWKKRKDEVSLS